MRLALAVAAGGALGSLLRWLVTQATVDASLRFPWGTLGVNVAGSLLLGVLLGAAPTGAAPPSALRLGLAVGLCGGFTTFSTFAAETLALLQRGAPARALAAAGAYVAASVLLGVAAVGAGVWLGRALLPGR